MAPWTAQSFKKHAHDLTDAEAERGAKVANAVMKKSNDEGRAIRVGISVAKSHRKRAAKKGGAR